MSAVEEAVGGEILRTRMGVMTHIAPRSALTAASTITELRTETEACLAQGDVQLVIDLTSVQNVNSAALELVLDIQNQAIRLGGWLKLANPNPIVLDVLRISGLSDYVSIMDLNPADYQQQPATSRKLGDILIAKGLLTEERISTAIEIQKRSSMRLGQIFIDKGWVTEHEVLLALGRTTLCTLCAPAYRTL